MRIQLPLILLLVINPAFRSLGQNDIGLAPWFGNGMVMQRSTDSLLQGYGPPGKKLAVRLWSGSRSLWDRPRSKISADGFGHWKLFMNLSPAEFQSRNKLWTLRIEEDKNSKHGREYTNIIIGDVIIVAGWENQGITAGLTDFVSGTSAKRFEHNKGAIRFLDLTHANFTNDLKHAPGANWENWPEDMSDFNRYSTLTIKLAYELSESKIPELSKSRYIGIVLARRKVLENALDPDRFKAPDGFESLDHKIWQWIADDACQAQTNRSKTTIQDKRHNVVTNTPPIIAYDPARLCSWKDFDTNKPPRESFSFAGAIWSAPQQEK